MLENIVLARTFICRAPRSALLIEKFAVKETHLLGFPYQLLASRHCAAGNFFFRNGDENRFHFNADSSAKFGDGSARHLLGVAVVPAFEHRTLCGLRAVIGPLGPGKDIRLGFPGLCSELASLRFLPNSASIDSRALRSRGRWRHAPVVKSSPCLGVGD